MRQKDPRVKLCKCKARHFNDSKLCNKCMLIAENRRSIQREHELDKQRLDRLTDKVIK